MHIVVDSASHDTLTLREQAPARLRFALRRFARVIDSVRVRLTDVNGPRQGEDKQCLLQLRLQPGGTVVVITRADEWAQALNRALQTAVRLTVGQMRRVRRQR